MTDRPSEEYRIEWLQGVPRITTRRLMLKICEDHDIDALMDFAARNVEHFQQWMPESALRPNKTFLGIAVMERRTAARQDQGYRFHLFHRDQPDKVIGLCSIADVRRGVIQQCVLGYAIDKEYEGQGLMKEAVAAAIRFAFDDLDLHRIEGSYMPNNEASAAILKSFGFEQQGFFKEYLFLNGAWQDHIVTFLINKNWKGTGRLNQ